MSLYSDSIAKLQSNKERRLRGDVVAIPWSLPRLSSVLPGIEQSKYYLVSAMPKAGKTALADYLFVYEPINWVIENKGNTDITLKIFYFSLEVNKFSKIYSAISYKLLKDYDIGISPQKLKSTFEDYVLDDKIEQIITSTNFIKWFNAYESIVTLYDDVRTGYGIFNVVRNYAESHGRYSYKTISWQNPDGTYSTKKIRDKYIPDNPQEYVIIIVDHFSLLKPTGKNDLRGEILKFSSEYCLEMRDKWGYIPVGVQQQAADSSKAIYDYHGEIIVNKIRPDKEGLADMKYTSRDVDVMLSLFYPYDYDILEYRGIDLKKLGRYHRELIISLNREGLSNVAIHMLFLGFASYFEEMPKIIDSEYYKKISQKIRQVL